MRYEHRQGYTHKHWMVFAPIHLKPVSRVFDRPPIYGSRYHLRPEVEEWLEANNTPHDTWHRTYCVFEDGPSMLVCFYHKADAMRFKLVWGG